MEIPFRQRMFMIMDAAKAAPAVEVSISHLSPGSCRLRVCRTGFRANDAYSAYIDMGAPKDLSRAQSDQLKELTRDLPEIDRGSSGKKADTTSSLSLRSNDVVLVTLEAIQARESAGTH